MSIYTDKLPKGKKDFIGIEIEFFAPISPTDLGTLLTLNKLEKYCRLKGDGSIRIPEKYRNPNGGVKCVCGHVCTNSIVACCICGVLFLKSESIRHWAHELCVLVTQSELSEVVNRVSKILLEIEAKVNKSCGLHVHLDMRHKDPSVCYRNLVLSQSILYKLVEKNRRRNTYCKRVKENETFATMLGAGRYQSINAASFSRFKSLEVRLHHGTIDGEEIIHWANLLNKIIDGDKIVKPVRTIKVLKLPVEIIDYISNQSKRVA
jgi:Putative amidoligase enzyme